MVHLSTITDKLEQNFPLCNACSWDNVGLLVGNRDVSVSKVLVALDFDINVAREAKEIGAELILKKVNFEIRDTEKIAVVGRNGCGKTTLLRLIAGELDLLKRDSDEDFLLQRQENQRLVI